MLDRDESARRAGEIIKLAEIFGKTLSDGALVMFVQTTEHIAAGKFDDALRRLAATSRFMPTPGDFSELAGTPPLPTPAEQNAAELARWGGKRH